ncbi:bifunctional transcriptional activator/DNA repair enzyme AdaA [Arundinibacter roseus]|uniref:methylated-DNA--[protein]-cysteine S-methyltransferase n=1 Tax=Arundinibacter roseus TaxID=2070510 RepID=A0A4R4KQJ9_9BACT|nr:methylated-DNA--[protein]-cysteine S-methyltransferase [Arundinibacter roseus]TDB69202.1 methylated-DNA--[protein]-cysteine S-methyltransferase [Arundinibacter roseus]
MEEPQSYLADYQRIEKAIRFIESNIKNQPGLRQIAEHVGLSEFHFQRLFTRWAGTSPHRFLRFLTKEYAKQQLAQSANLLDATLELGLSSPSRLHDLFVTYEAMTPAEFRALGEGVTMRYGLHNTPLGTCLMVVTERGLTDLRFLDEAESGETALQNLQTEWPQARWLADPGAGLPYLQPLFDVSSSAQTPLPLLLRGTNFQIKVWEALLRIPAGKLVSYDDIARTIGQPTASRAVGTAIGSNRIALLIPCHRVLQKTGGLGGYRWGTARKLALIGREAGQLAEISDPELF